MTKLIIYICLVITVFASACTILNNPAKMKNYVLFTTDMGEFAFGLYEGTPEHRDQFLKLCKVNYYDSLLVFRASPKGYIATGDTLSRYATATTILGDNITETAIHPEFNKKLINRKGAVGFLRADDKINPNKMSHSGIVYFVVGEVLDEKALRKLETQKNAPVIGKYVSAFMDEPEHTSMRDSMLFYRQNRLLDDFRRLYLQATDSVMPRIKRDNVKLFAIDKYQEKTYTTIGGLPTMDGENTVFGQVVYGLNTLEQITKVKTGVRFRPRKDIYILSTEVMNKKEWKAFTKAHKKTTNQ